MLTVTGISEDHIRQKKANHCLSTDLELVYIERSSLI